MGKYIIEVDESEIVECWNEQAAKELGYQEYALKQCPKIKVKLYNPTGDLISREALGKAIEAVEDKYDGYEPNDLGKFINKVHDLIDTAQAVDIKDQIAGAYNEGYMCGNKEAEKARPQGEWIDYDNTFYECPECGYLLNKLCPQCHNEVILPSCGRMMKGGAE